MSQSNHSISLFGKQGPSCDRRGSGRSKFHMQARGERVDNTIDARRRHQVGLTVHDFSVGGIAATADRPLQTGEHLALYFPPFDTSRGCDRYGKIVRCDRMGNGYEVGICFERAMAA